MQDFFYTWLIIGHIISCLPTQQSVPNFKWRYVKFFSLKPAVRRNSVPAQFRSLRCLLSLNVRNGRWWALKTKTHTGGCFPVSVCLSVFSPSSINPTWYTACSGILTQPIKLLYVHEYALEGLCKRFRFRQLMFLFLLCKDLQFVCLNIYPSERIRFSCKMFAISLPLGTALVWHYLVLRFSVTVNAICRLGWWHFKTHILLRWFNYLYN